jgi:hypothetical protein
MSAGEPVDRPDTEKRGAGGSGHSPGAGAPRIEGTDAAITVKWRNLFSKKYLYRVSVLRKEMKVRSFILRSLKL